MISRKILLLITLITSMAGWLSADQVGVDSCAESFARSEWNSCSVPQLACADDFSRHFFVRGDVLYWKPHISGLELGFGSSSTAQTVTDGVLILNTDEFDATPHFNWEAGYRVAAGYQFDCSSWEIGAYWTDFQGGGGRKSTENGDTLNKGKCRLKFNQLDVVLAYNASPQASFMLKPFIGVRAVKIHESLRAHLVTGIELSPTVLTSGTTTLDDSQNFRGIGPVLGLQGDWDVGCGFGVYGTVAASVLYGHCKVHFDDTDAFAAPISKKIFSRNQRCLHAFDCNMDLALGLRWQTWICDGYQLSLMLGFEHHQYFNQSHLSANRGDLSLDGGTFSANIAF